MFEHSFDPNTIISPFRQDLDAFEIFKARIKKVK